MPSPDATVIQRAQFNPLIRPYLVLYVSGLMVLSVVGIPLAIVWCLGIGQWWARHYFDRLECELSERTLRYRKGILVHVEKTIPLENIQDVTFIEGPLLRRFHLAVLKFETAGHSAGQANDMKLIGIIDAMQFRNRILEARDRMRRVNQGANSSVASYDADQVAVLREMQKGIEEAVVLLRRIAERS